MENNKENIFLGKLEVMLLKFDELDSIFSEINNLIKEQPSNQQQIDWELSDYYHKLEDITTTDVEFINIGKKIQQARLIRADYQRTYELIKAYNENKEKIFYCPKTNREDFRKAIKYAMKYLHEDYKYRVLTNEQLQDLKDKHGEIETSDHCKYKISKEDLLNCLQSGMKGIEIAEKYKVDPSTVTRLKQRYGIRKEDYKKRG